MKKIKKSLLKQNYYYEEKPWYDTLPKILTVPDYRTEIFGKIMSHKEILESYNIKPYENIQDAFAVAADCIDTLENNYNGRLVYFMDGDTRYRLDVCCNSGGELEVYIRKVNPDLQWGAGNGVLFSNGNSDTSIAALGHSDTLPLTDEKAISYLKEKGYRITKMIETEF